MLGGAGPNSGQQLDPHSRCRGGVLPHIYLRTARAFRFNAPPSADINASCVFPSLLHPLQAKGKGTLQTYLFKDDPVT